MQSFKICYLAGRDYLGHVQMKFVIELIILHSVLKIFCPALPLNVRVYLKDMDKLQKWVPHTRTSKKVRINICPQTISFRGTAQQNFDLSPIDFYLFDTLNPIFYSAPIENEDTSLTYYFMPVETFTISPGPLKGCVSCVTMCAFTSI